jgi:ubiquinone/menaquinone biosynthesis C-methylase UbiE
VSGALDPHVRAHYELGIERERLAEGRGRLEYLRTQEVLGRVLPPPPGTVLDVGGGSGSHALPLARRGYDVHLLDPVPLHVEQARATAGAERLRSAEVGDARDLPWPEASVDAVLLLGPLYHLTDAGDRGQALGEARRVLRPGGVLVAAAISRFASTHDGLRTGWLAEPGFEAMVEGDVSEGQHRNPSDRPEWFTTAYFHAPDELRDEVARAGLEPLELLAVEGPAGVIADPAAWLDGPERRELLLRAIRRVESEPSLLGASDHLLVVARRGAAP